MKPRLVALLAGAVFGVGLVLSGMTDPNNVIGFLDFAGRWKPALAFVMAGAIGVHGLALRLGRRAPATGTPSLEPRARIDAPLLVGSVIFGVGWGLAGYCPGPAIVALGYGRAAPFFFVFAASLGILIADRVMARLQQPSTGEYRSATDLAELPSHRR